METEQNRINWNAEAEKLEKGKEWFNADAGTHRIHIVKECELFETEYKGQIIKKRRFEIKVGEKADVINWSVSLSKTLNGLWGQLALLGRKWGTLEDKEITLAVKKDKDGKRNYMVLEALDLMNEIRVKELGK